MIFANIFGSCVSRDSLEFADGVVVRQYSGRQSIVSAFIERPGSATLDKLIISSNSKEFHRRCIEEDFYKTAVNKIKCRSQNEILVIDLIEERMPLGVTDCGTYISLSDAARLFSNACDLVVKEIKPWSRNHLDLLLSKFESCGTCFGGRRVIIHRAFYAEDQRSFASINGVLRDLYDELEHKFSDVVCIEVPVDLRRQNMLHKWRPGPYHYIDGYYHNFVQQMRDNLNLPINISDSYTLNSN